MKHILAVCGALALLLGCSRTLEKSTQPTPQSAAPSAAVSTPALPQPAANPLDAFDVNDWRLILVNADHPLPADFLVTLAQIPEGYAVDARIVDSWNALQAAAKADGVALLPCYGHRSPEQSAQLFEKQINRQMQANGLDRAAATEAAKAVVAPPGYSEHHTGLALDIVTPEHQVLNAAFAKTAAAQWLAQNAHRYGFVLRYPENKQAVTNIIFEPWHYRFVGVEAAEFLFENDLCLEEFVAQLADSAA